MGVAEVSAEALAGLLEFVPATAGTAGQYP
jgi:hypothetical protein